MGFSTRSQNSPPIIPLTIGVIPSIVFVEGGGVQTYELSQHVTYLGESALQYSLASGALTAGLSLDPNTGTLTYDGTTPTDDTTISIEVTELISVTTLEVTSNSGGSVPWTAGAVFREADVPDYISSNTVPFQVDVMNRWPDGSVKFAIVSGISPNGEVVLKRSSTPTGGTNVSPIIAGDVGNTFVTIDGVNIYLVNSIPPTGADLTAYSGSSGTQPAVAGKIRDWLVGPVMRESHYYAPVPSKPGLGVFWYVRKYQNGAVEIETIVENGWQRITGAAIGYVVSVTINNTVRPWFDNISNKTLTHQPYTRWVRVDWKDPTNETNTYVLHDVQYIEDTRLVPNYGWPVPCNEDAFLTCRAATSLSARVMASVTDAEVRRPAPLTGAIDTVFWRPAQDAGGEEDYGQIGLLPSWECVYLRTRDIRALRTTLYSGRTWQFIPTWRRDEMTLKLPRTHPTYRVTYSHDNAEREHQPSTGFLPYLLTGRYFFMEQQQNTALWNFFKTNYVTPWPVGGGNGRDGLRGILVSGELAPRAVAWPWRNLFQAACISPSEAPYTDPLAADLVYCAQENIEYFWGLQRDNTPLANNLGIVWTANGDSFYSTIYFNTGVRQPQDPVGPVVYWQDVKMWMHAFLSACIGCTRGLKVTTNLADHQSLHEFSVLAHIGLMGNSYDETDWSWWRCAVYDIMVGYTTIQNDLGSGFNPPQSMIASWREVYELSLAYWGATDHTDDTDFSQSTAKAWLIGGTFYPGLQPDPVPLLSEVPDQIASMPSIMQTRNCLLPLGVGADWDCPGAMAAYDKFIGTAVYRDNATARQLLANGPRFNPTPRGKVW